MNKNDYKLLEGEFGVEIKLIDFTKKIILNSYGGELGVGLAAYDLLKPIKDSEAGVIGVCASSAIQALLGASKRWGTENSKFCIHNPWVDISGDADKLRATAIELQKEQDRLVQIYDSELKIGKPEIIQLMKKDELFGAEKALEIGLIHEIKKDELQSVSGKLPKEMFFNLKKNNQMNKQELKNELEKNSNSILEKLKNLLGSKIKNILVKDVNGVELDFDVETVEEIQEGTNVTADGAAANGDYVMEDGKTITIESGVVTGVVEAPANEEMEALKTENEELQNKLEEEQKAKNEALEEVQNLKKGLKEVKDQVSKFKNSWTKKVNGIATPEDGNGGDGVTVRRSRKKKE